MFQWLSRKQALLFVIPTALIMGTLSAKDPSSHWGYSGTHGPSHWGNISEKFALCSLGKEQSPINILTNTLATENHITLDYQKTVTANLINNGHAIQGNVSDNNLLHIANDIYTLKQFHFHTPSEHHITDHSFPMELHLVHQNKSGHLAIIGIMIKEDDSKPEQAELAKIANQIPQLLDKKVKSPIMIDLKALAPLEAGYYRYYGSLTTPPCTENVKWFIAYTKLHATQKQLATFKSAFSFTNNRPLQKRHNRYIESFSR